MVIFGIVNRDAYNQLILLIKRLRADKNSFWVLVDLERGSVLESPSMTAYSGSIFVICRLFLDFNEVKYIVKKSLFRLCPFSKVFKFHKIPTFASIFMEFLSKDRLPLKPSPIKMSHFQYGGCRQ